MNPLEKLKAKQKTIEERIGYQFQNQELFLQIFIHTSFFNEHPKLTEKHNERLEFLGDSVLGLIVADMLFELLPEENEGKLSFLLSNIVNAQFCSEYMKSLNVQEYLLLGKGEAKSQGRGRDTILADAFEALIAGIYLDGGFPRAKEFFYTNFKEKIIDFIDSPAINYKAVLQDYSQKMYQKPPTYQIVKESGLPHDRSFKVAAIVANRSIGVGVGSSKKQAEQNAAKDALEKLEEIE